ncbi:Acg family FMN-binding oxidoreductase [Mongoliimonas terrestris]|uniref:Acg family FMN-binding oxidoreductase n=1 Tax=Mongoliimonas terrestris TaxID=1709001 RepID=UPI0009496613|nr:nitroreductase family protein [Mongoliimonas terrestris]
MTNRRVFLTLFGGGVVLAATSATLWATTRDPAGARRPWETAGQGGEADPRRRALSFAVLAPNPHNRQPWVADLSVPEVLTLFCDPDRRLPHTDPFDRQITIGLGCFLELLALAAAEDGYRTDIAVFPDGAPQPRLDGRPVARVRFIRDEAVARDPLFAAVLDRRSNKEAYDTTRPVATESLAAIAAAARVHPVAFTNDPARVAALRGQAFDALRTEMTTYATAKESVDLLRIGKREIEANPDGIDLPGPVFEALQLAGMMPRDAMLDTTSDVFAQQLAAMKVPFDTAMAFVWTITPGNSRAEQIEAGRDWVRLNLAATRLGVAMHPFSQALQEFAEMRPHFDGLRQALGIPPEHTLQMFARLGYGPSVKAGPRWPYETRIRAA